jgi:hypothetical protein
MAITNPTVNKVFSDLEEFCNFCRFEGHVFNEADLYKSDARAWQAFTKHRNWLRAKSRVKVKRNA